MASFLLSSLPKMWAKFKTSITNRDGKEMRESHRVLNVNEEYLGVLRTKSYADFFIKAQVLVNEPSSPFSCHHKFTEVLLEPGQEDIDTVLKSAILSKKSDLKDLILNYFDISAEASEICTNLLKSISQIQYNHKFIQKVLDAYCDDYNSPEQSSLTISELHSFIVRNNPLSAINKQDFKNIHDKHSSVLQCLKIKRKKVARNIKLIKCFNKGSGVCVTVACGLVAVTAVVLAAHTLTALLMGPAILSLPLKPLKKKLVNIRFLRSAILKKVGDQLDVAAKGTYILNRDFDTMSRLVARLHDEVEHNKAMVQFCLERREDRLSLQVLKELKKSEVGFRKQVEELEEHVYLCLVTINRARALVVKEISSSCVRNEQ
ncbi:hypothetical protein RJ639_042236 [Escallonia herrerae]|uniref:Uncharacterized protein n=1 Tax=Escallonia herrerae TaxID=1293975 RepID=A0AA88WH71_9ASTE|nr:hypothetical protein RJ639_042236 [Escallonia herrerae]